MTSGHEVSFLLPRIRVRRAVYGVNRSGRYRGVYMPTSVETCVHMGEEPAWLLSRGRRARVLQAAWTHQYWRTGRRNETRGSFMLKISRESGRANRMLAVRLRLRTLSTVPDHGWHIGWIVVEYGQRWSAGWELP